MKRKYLYPAALVLFITAVAFIFLRFNTIAKEASNYQIKERSSVLADAAEYQRTKASASRLKMKLEDKPEDDKSALALTSIFIQEARITGDYIYYDQAAMHYVNQVLQRDPENFLALTYKALIYLSQHHFADGRDVAEKAKTINPYNAFIYGLLVDANVEMGNYKQAISYSDSMVSMRPDLSSYSRISYLREIHGDYPGAISAMNMAVDAGMPGDEGTEWARIQLAHLYENTGDLKNAEFSYRIALDERKNYPFALAGLGRIYASQKNYSEALKYYIAADSIITDYGIKEEMVDVYKLAGQSKKSEELANTIIGEMNKDAEAGNEDENIGHYADRELAYAYLKINDKEKALNHALAEYNRRPKNNDANETVAWVYYSRGQAEKSIPFIEEALKTNSRNPVLLGRAGLIYMATGKTIKAKDLLQSSIKSSPLLNPELYFDIKKALQKL